MRNDNKYKSTSQRVTLRQRKTLVKVKAPCLSCGKLDNVDYFEAGRSARKRSLLPVNEHFERKPDAKRITLGNFSLIRTHRLVRTQ